MEYVFAPAPIVAVPIAESVDTACARISFPIRRIYCVGRNYAAHAREMGHDERRCSGPRRIERARGLTVRCACWSLGDDR